MRALVTGAAGFVGANLVRALLQAGHETVAWVRPAGDHWRLTDVAGDIELAEVELRDAEAISAAVDSARPELVFHLAAHGAYSWQRDLEQILEVNLGATARLLASCQRHGFHAFVHAGTSSEYGFQDHAPSEDELVQPNSDYATMKAAATLHCRSIAQRHDLHVVTLRLYSVYGPWEEPDRLMPRLAARGLAGELPPLVSPDTPRDYVSSRDATRAFLLAAERDDVRRGAIFNVGRGEQTTLREVVAIVRRQLDVAAEPQWGAHPQRAWDATTWVSNPAKAREQLGWTAADDVDAGFCALAGWLRERRELWPRYGIEPISP